VIAESPPLSTDSSSVAGANESSKTIWISVPLSRTHRNNWGEEFEEDEEEAEDDESEDDSCRDVPLSGDGAMMNADALASANGEDIVEAV